MKEEFLNEDHSYKWFTKMNDFKIKFCDAVSYSSEY